jgi:hypothetical protein
MTLRSKDVNAGEGEQPEVSSRSGIPSFSYRTQQAVLRGVQEDLHDWILSLPATQATGREQGGTLEEAPQLLGMTLVTQKKAEEEFKDKMRKEAPEKKKRNRRTADEIEKAYECSAERCQRSYGSEGSLIQHIKLKHPDLYDEMIRSGQLKSNHSDSGQHS